MLIASLLFLVIGPAVGYVLGFGLYLGDVGADAEFGMTVAAFALFAAVAYFIGAVPAVITGVLAGFLYGRCNRFVYYVSVMALGALATIVMIGGVFSSDPGMPMMPGLLGLVASAVCAWFSRFVVTHWWPEARSGHPGNAGRS